MAQRVVLVTGASTGIGHQAAIQLAKAGLIVYAGARRVDKMEPLKSYGVNVLELDVTRDDSMVSAVQRVIDEQDKVDVLVNNAGYGSYGSLEETPLDEGRRQFEVNVFGLARMTQLVLPHMRRAGEGRIINVSSMGGKIYEATGSWYHASKFAVEGMSDSLRLELAPHGIAVSIIEPSGTATEWGRIAGELLLAVSGQGAYAAQARSQAAALASTEDSILGTPPQVAARTIVRASTAKRPRTRYPTGRGAGSILAARRLLPDRAFDALLRAIYSRFSA